MARGTTVSGFNYGTTRAQAAAQGNFELWAWLFMRISGILLVLLALGHLALMHVINTVEVIDYQFVANRWSGPLSAVWRTYDTLLLALALVHGLNGVRIVIDDYVHHRGWRVFWMSLLYVGGLFFIVLGTLVIFTFMPKQ